MMKKNILITGGAGFIGSHVVRLMVTKYPDYQIINLDALTYAGNLENLKDIENAPNYHFVKANILDVEALKDIFKQDIRSNEDLSFTLTLIKKYNIIVECYKKAEHFINLASNALTVFKDSDEKKVLENLTSFSLERSF